MSLIKKNIPWHMLIFLGVLALGTFLRFYRLQENLIFNGEMGYDYTTIKGYVDRGQIPLIGPRTSHEWFFIGPLFYWIFGLLLPVFGWNVLSGAVFMVAIGSFSIVACYWVIKRMFSTRVALLASFLLSVSPLWLELARDARFNSLTALLFFPFYYFLLKSVKNAGKSLFVLGLILGAMFSFFPSPILLLPGTLLVLFLFGKKIPGKRLLAGFTGLLIPNIPYLIYNAANKFEILINLFLWIPYRVLGFFGLYPKNTADLSVLSKNFTGFYDFFRQSWSNTDGIFAFLLFVLAAGFTVKTEKSLPLKILLILLGVTYLGLFVHGNPPRHYYLIVFPVPLILLAIFLDKVWNQSKLLVVSALIVLTLVNFKYYFSQDWFYLNTDKVSVDGYFVPYKLQQEVADFIVKDSGGRELSVSRVGKLDYFDDDFSLNYQYLIDVKGGVLNKNAGLVYTIYEDLSQIPDAGLSHRISNLIIVRDEK